MLVYCEENAYFTFILRFNFNGTFNLASRDRTPFMVFTINNTKFDTFNAEVVEITKRPLHYNYALSSHLGMLQVSFTNGAFYLGDTRL